MTKMITRIVKMEFKKERVPDFLDVFEEVKQSIRTFDGCAHLALLRHCSDDRIFFTYTLWENEEALEAYRCSGLFRATWSKTKKMFEKKAEAWSLNQIDLLT